MEDQVLLEQDVYKRQSLDYADRPDLFENLEIWKNEKYRKLQGTYPVISLSFANIKEPTYELTKQKICELIVQLYVKYSFITEGGRLSEPEVKLYKKIMNNMDYVDATLSLYHMSRFLYEYYGKKVIILLDEYDTPMQEALSLIHIYSVILLCVYIQNRKKI